MSHKEKSLPEKHKLLAAIELLTEDQCTEVLEYIESDLGVAAPDSGGENPPGTGQPGKP